MADEYTHVCAGCGIPIRPSRTMQGAWQDQQNTHVCTMVLDKTKLRSADYHYVEGETQRTFRAEDWKK